MEISQIINEIYNNKECQICFESFIKLTNEQYEKFIKDNDELLPDDFFMMITFVVVTKIDLSV